MRKEEGAFTAHLRAAFLLDITILLDQKKVERSVLFYLYSFVICEKPSFIGIYAYNSTGWTPQSFTSSRKKRAEPKEQNIYSFMDEDEKAVGSQNSYFLHS